jgi:tRNA threonylcarbamoyladenosine biosynthesis protein TsaB
MSPGKLAGMSTPCVLAIECATDLCSVAVLRAGQTWQLQEQQRDKHSETLLPLINDVLAKSGCKRAALTHIAAGVGPGSFTGVRTAVSVAQGLALGMGLPLYGVVSLEALALAVSVEQPVRLLVALDARMHEVYAAIYEANTELQTVSVIQAPVVLPPAQLASWRNTGIQVAIGNVRAIYANELEDLNLPWQDALPQARHVAQLAATRIAAGAMSAITQCQPLYVRNRVAATIAERLSEGLAA